MVSGVHDITVRVVTVNGSPTTGHSRRSFAETTSLLNRYRLMKVQRLDAVARNAYDQACTLLHSCASPFGFAAAGGDSHYGGVWARDAAYSSWGALLVRDRSLTQAAAESLRTLARHQGRFGQIPNTVWPARSYWDWGENGSTDSSALFVIAVRNYWDVTHDDTLVGELLPHAERALSWLSHQDASNWGLIDSPSAAEWMDSTLNRRGKVFYVNVLYAEALSALEYLGGDLGSVRPTTVVERINSIFWPESEHAVDGCLAHELPSGRRVQRFPHVTTRRALAAAIDPERQHYLSHVDYGNVVDRLDVLANCLAILFGVAVGERARIIAIRLASAADKSPYPSRAWDEPDNGEDARSLWDRGAEVFQDPRWHNAPYRYHNAGVWPMIGGFLVAALARAGLLVDAKRQLVRLIDANRQARDGGHWGFHEWLDGRDGSPQGTPFQAWSAGALLVAIRSVTPGIGQ